jgi:lycopene cyclase domain-containing protein
VAFGDLVKLYTTGIDVAGLPIEEILFFITVPYASIFIYAFVNKLWPNTPRLDKAQKYISYAILIIAIVVLIFNYDKAYTALNCGYAIVLLSLQLFVVKGAYMGKFYRFYFWHLIPFFIVNGILTGTGIDQEVVWYNNTENLGIRMGTIPVEDSLYSLSLMLMNITILEYLKSRFKKHNQIPIVA